MIDVIFVRDVRCLELDGSEPARYYAKRAALPMAPYEGLGVLFHAGLDPEEIKFVFLNLDNDVICLFEEEAWTDADLIDDPENGKPLSLERRWAKQKQFLVGKDWIEVGPLPCYGSKAFSARRKK